jgi:two-component system nitrogen regulation response regulator GlnG
VKKNVRSIAPEAMEQLRSYPWPGNVRELQSVLKQTLLQATGPVLLPEFLPPTLRGPKQAEGMPPQSAFDFGDLPAFIENQLGAGTTTLYSDYQAMTDKYLLSEVLRSTGENLSQAARVLGITRATLRTKLHALGILAQRPNSSGDSLP